MIILQTRNAGREAKGAVEQHFIFRLVRTVFAAPLTAQKLHGGQRLVPCNLGHIIADAVFIIKFGLFDALRRLIAEDKPQLRIDNRLPLEHIQIIGFRNLNVREHFQIRTPANLCAGVRTGVLFLFKSGFGAGAVFALFKMQAVFCAVAAHGDIHIFRGILCRAGTQTIQSQ